MPPRVLAPPAVQVLDRFHLLRNGGAARDAFLRHKWPDARFRDFATLLRERHGQRRDPWIEQATQRGSDGSDDRARVAHGLRDA